MKVGAGGLWTMMPRGAGWTGRADFRRGSLARGPGSTILRAMDHPARTLAFMLLSLSCSCAFFSDARTHPAPPALQPVPSHMSGAKIHLPSPAIRGPEARHAIDVAAELHRATATALTKAGFVVLQSPSPDAAELRIDLVVDYCFVDVSKLEIHALVTREGRAVGNFVVPGIERPTGEVPSVVSVLIANALGSVSGLSSNSPQAGTTNTPAPGDGSGVVPREPSIVAILDLQDPDVRLNPKARGQLTEYLTAQAIQKHGWTSIPRAQLREQLQQEKAASYSSCVDEACQIELGKAVAAQKTLVTKVLHIGQSCTMVMTLYDLRLEAAEAAATAKTGCSTAELTAGIDDLLSKLARPTHKGARP